MLRNLKMSVGKEPITQFFFYTKTTFHLEIAYIRIPDASIWRGACPQQQQLLKKKMITPVMLRR